jgi:hypothetical protein
MNRAPAKLWLVEYFYIAFCLFFSAIIFYCISQSSNTILMLY